MPLDPYPFPHEVVQSQAAAKITAFQEATVNAVGGGVWSRERRTRGSGAGQPAVVTTTSGVTPVWIFKGAWPLPGGTDQPVEGYRYVAEPGLVSVEDQLASAIDPTLRFVIVTVEREANHIEGRARPLG